MEEVLTIDNTERAFLALLCAALHGSSAELPDQVNWIRLFQLASRHHVLPLILESAWQDPAIPEPLLESARFSAMNVVIRQAQRTAAFLSLYQYLSQNGIHPLVLKGLICRNLYPQPDDRPSNDEDLLIKPSEFNTAHNALLSYGMICTVSDPSESMHEITYTSELLRIELHLSLFPEDSTAYGDCNTLFEDVHEKAVSVDIDGITISTLSPDDHILYLICHTYKHFLHTGVGIRQVCDIGIYSEYYEKDISWEQLRKKCDRIHITPFTAALFRIASNHLGFFMPDVFSDIKTDENDLINDMLSGGVYGAIDGNRLHSSTITIDAVSAQKQGRKRGGPLSSVFLPLKSMREKFPYLKKYPWLLPVAWIQRVCIYLTDKNKKSNPAESLRIGSERIQLLKEYGILRDTHEKPGILKRLYRSSHSSFLAPVLSALYVFISMAEYHILNLYWSLIGEKAPSESDKELVRENITFIVKSFERQKLVKGLCRNIQKMYPGTAIIIADDSRKPLIIDIPEVKVIQLPFNSGLSTGLAAALKEVRTPYLVRLDDDELLTVRTKVHRELRFLMDHSELDLIGFGHTTAIMLRNPELTIKEYYKYPMEDALCSLKVPHMTKIDDNHIVLGKVANLYLARTEKIREVGFDPKIRMIDHHDFFWRAAGVLVSAIAKDTVVFHRHNPYERNYQSYRSDVAGDREYIREKRKKMIQEAKAKQNQMVNDKVPLK